jgi:hypothetical protein
VLHNRQNLLDLTMSLYKAFSKPCYFLRVKTRERYALRQVLMYDAYVEIKGNILIIIYYLTL